MKKTKRILAVLLICVMTLACSPAVCAGAVRQSAPQSPSSLPALPEGYHFSQRTYADENGSVYYYIETQPSETGWINGCWMNAEGELFDLFDTPMVQDITRDLADENSNLPETYDARDYGLITTAEDQIGGSCWAHAAAAVMEANAIKKGYATKDTIDLSEYYLAWFSKNSYFPGVTDSRNDGYIDEDYYDVLKTGGNYDYIAEAVYNFSGPVKEEKYAFASKNQTDLSNEMLQKFTFADRFDYDYAVISVKSFAYSVEAVKQAVLAYGACQISYYHDNGYYTIKPYWNLSDDQQEAYYYPVEMMSNHAVTIVGWDDDFGLEHFTKEGACPEAPGAWLVKNSFGDDWANNGYFWLSYEEPSLRAPAVYEVAPRADFQNVYFYDGVGSKSSIRCSSAANVFTANQDEILTKVSTGRAVSASGSYSFKVYLLDHNAADPTDGTLLYEQSGNGTDAKYIDLDTSVRLNAGERFSVVFDGLSTIPAEASSSSATMGYNSNAGESFYYTDGAWMDVKDNQYNNISIRAVTHDVTQTYKVTYTDQGAFRTIYSANAQGAVSLLPDVAVHTYVYEYNGQPFNGTGVEGDITVTAHLYPTNGSGNVCVNAYKCVFCGREMLPTELSHEYDVTTVEPSATAFGMDIHSCSKCGDRYVDNVKAYLYRDNWIISNLSLDGVFHSVNFQRTQGAGVVYTDTLYSYTTPWSSVADQITTLYFNDFTEALAEDSIPNLPNVTEVHIPASLTSISSSAMLRYPSLTEFIVDENNPAYCDVDGVLYTKDMQTLVRYPAGREDVYFKAPATVTSIAPYAFDECGHLRYLDLDDTRIAVLPQNAIYQNAALENIDLPSCLASLEASAIVNPQSAPQTIAALYIPASVTAAENAFIGNYNGAVISVESACAAVINAASAAGYTVNALSGHTHDYARSAYVLSEATCAAPGSAILVCDCGSFIADAYYAPHQKGTAGETVAPTCLEDGYTVYTCSVCGNTFHADIVAANGEHRWEWVEDIAPGCATPGVKHRECAVCHETCDENTAIAPTGNHNYTAETVKPEAKKSDATCTSPAVYYYACSVCGAVEHNDDHTFTYGDPAAHSWEWKIDTAATCSTPGEKHMECSKCHATKDENTVIEPTGEHTYTEREVKDDAKKSDATCTALAVYYYSCKDCGTVEHNDSHTFTSGSYAAHSYTAATVKEQAKKSDATCESPAVYYYSCVKCGAVEHNDAHTFTSGDTTAHNWEWKFDKEPTCGETGLKHQECSKCHNTQNENTVEPATGNHSWEWKTDTPATCRDEGVKHQECKKCHATQNSGTAIPKTDNHSWNDGAVTKPATCTEEGVKTFTCTVCGKTRTETIGKTAHSDANGDGFCDNCNTPVGGQQQESNCVCGQYHTGPFAGIIKFFHKIIYFFKNLFN